MHGSYWCYYESIQAKGLLAGGSYGRGFLRNHIHFFMVQAFKTTSLRLNFW